MLNIYRKGAVALAAALTFAATAAQAERHVVLIVQGSYFPSVVFAVQGDTIEFQNNSGAAHTVSGPEESWTSGDISANSFFSLDVDENTPATFSGSGGGFEIAYGEIVFQDIIDDD